MFDSDQFEMVTGADPEIAQEIADLFRKDVRELLAELAGALDADEGDDARRFAHTMKSSTGSVGVVEASATAATIEAEGVESGRRLLATLREQVDRGIEEMDAYVAALPTPS